jgi:lipid II isoglutaminyl synthase (glutamine-hydrolysing)
MKITLGCLYPDIMSTYGDRGNVATLRRRCEWRGIAVELRELRLGDRAEPDELDLIVIGSGGESQQRLIAADLNEVKGAGIREAVRRGAAALAVGSGFELFGQYSRSGEGGKLPGVGLFDAWTIGHRAILSEQYSSLTEARADRAMGDLVVRWQDRLLVGFENHGGRTYLGPTATPLGRVVSGVGNNGDGSEGVQLGNAVGTHLRGPCLPRNPALADFLISAALRRRHGDVELPPLADDVELAAREVAMERARMTARARRGRVVLRRPAWRGSQAGASTGGRG